MTAVIIFISLIGIGAGSLLVFLLGDARQRAELKSNLSGDDAVVRDFYARTKRIWSVPGADCVPVRKILASAEQLLDLTVELLAKTAAETSVDLALECETGVRTALGTVKGLLDCAEALVLPAAREGQQAAGDLLAGVESLRRLTADRVGRGRSAGLRLDAEEERVSLLQHALEADAILVRSDPAQAVAVLARQIGVLNEVLAEVGRQEGGRRRS